MVYCEKRSKAGNSGRGKLVKRVLPGIVRFHKYILLFAAIILLPLPGISQEEPAAAQSEAQKREQTGADKPKKAQRLRLGKAVEREMRGGESHAYRVHLKRGEFLHAVVEQRGIDLGVALLGPDGSQIAFSESGNDKFGPETISAVAEATGQYELRIIAEAPDEPPGRYQALITALRKPTTADLDRLAADRAFQVVPPLATQDTKEGNEKAIEKLEAVLPLWKKVGDRYAEGLTLHLIALLYSKLGQNPKALQYYQRALPIREEVGERSGIASTLLNIGFVQAKLGNSKEALEYYAKALPLWRELGDRATEAIALNNIGRAYDNLGDRQKALEYLSQALAIDQAMNNVGQQAVTLNNIGLVYHAMGDQQKALSYYERALPLRKKAGDKSGEGTTLNNIALTYTAIGELEKALDHYQRALQLERQVGNRFMEANVLSNIAGTLVSQGEMKEALELFEQSLSMRRAMGDRHGEATVLGQFSRIYSKLGEYRRALEFSEQALSLRRAVGDRYGEGVTLDGMGYLYSSLGQIQEAVEYLQQALSLERAVGDRAGEGYTLQKLGFAYYISNEKTKALASFSSSLALAQEVRDPELEAMARVDIGMTCRDDGDKQKALDSFSLALSLARRVGNAFTEAEVLYQLMDFWKEEGRPAVAIYFGKQAVNRIQGIRRNIRGFEKETQQAFLRSKEDTYRGLADLLIGEGRLTEAEQVLDLLKKQEYFDFIRRDGKSAESLTGELSLSAADRKIDAEYREAIEPATKAAAEWAELRAKPTRTPEEEQRLGELNDQLKTANQAIKKLWEGLYAEYGKTAEARSTVSRVQDETSDLQSLLKDMEPGTVVLYTLVGDEKYRVLIITPNAMVDRSSDISRGKLRRKVFDFRQALQDPGSNPLPSAQYLYKILVEPVRKDLEGARAKTLVWILDDDLRYVPMTALHDGKGYLAEQYENVVITRAIVSRLKDKADVSAWRGVGMGVSKSYEGMQELPAVPKELHAVIREENANAPRGVVPGKVMLDEAFTLGNMTKAMEQKLPLLHIASHFVFSPGDETRSFLVIGGKEDKDENHRLTLSDIRERPEISFDHAELLALSGCETAVGEMEGESKGVEIDGLAQIAERKGAKAVLASLWSVNDTSTGQLMADFYHRWIHAPGMTKAEALRQAQLAMLHGESKGGSAPAANKNSQSSFAHPYYWAPFILIGNWQ
jgi:CHAT domain-containing protein/Tfp pilus assembly protein PilF